MLAVMKISRAFVFTSAFALVMFLSVAAFTSGKAQAEADRVALFVETLIEADTEMLGRLLASNFVFIGSNGKV